MSIYLSNETEVLGQFSSNAGYGDFISASEGYPAISALFKNGGSEEISKLAADLEKLIETTKDPDVKSSAQELKKLLNNQNCVVVTDGTSPEEDVDKGDHGDSVMVCFTIPSDVAQALAVEDGEAPEELHLTLAYLGHVGKNVPLHVVSSIASTLQSFAMNYAPIYGTIGGPIRFNASESSDGKDVCVASFQSPAIRSFREEIVSYLKFAGAEPFNNFDYTPHITLAYLLPREEMPVDRIDLVNITFDKISLVVGETVTDFPLTGTNVTKANEDQLEEEDESSEDDKSESEDLEKGIEISGNIIKLDGERQLAFGWFSIVEIDGRPLTDTQGDIIDESTIEEAAYDFVLEARKGGNMHESNEDGSIRGVGRLVESVVFTKEKQVAMVKSLQDQGIDAVLDLKCIAWWGGMHVEDSETWKKIKEGHLRAWSIGGKGKRAAL